MKAPKDPSTYQAANNIARPCHSKNNIMYATNITSEEILSCLEYTMHTIFIPIALKKL